MLSTRIGSLVLLLLAAAFVVLEPSTFGASVASSEHALATLGGPLGALTALGLGMGRVFMDRADDVGSGGGGAGTANPTAPQHSKEARENAEADAAARDTSELDKVIRDLGEANKLLRDRAAALEGMPGELTALRNELDAQRAEFAQITKDMRRPHEQARNVAEHELGAEGVKNFSVMRCIQASHYGWNGPLKGCPEQRALQAYYEERALPHDTLEAGQMAVLIPPEFMEGFIERLSAKTVSFTLGAQFLGDMDGAPIHWPKVEGGATAGWVGELSEPSDSEVGMGELTMTPKELACSAPITKKLLRLTNNRAMRVLESDMERAVAEALDLGILTGPGGEGSPLGIINVAGAGQTDWQADLGDITSSFHGADSQLAGYLDLMVAKVDARNAYDSSGSMGWACHPLTLNKFRQARDADGRPLLFDQMAGGNRPTAGDQGAAIGTGRGNLWGHTVATTTNLSQGAVADLIFGNWRDVLVTGWGSLTVEVSSGYQNYFKLRRLLVLMTQLVDAGVRHPEAFEIATNLDLTSIPTVAA